ncbi:acyl carrier protein [Raoultibacter massiliensis]|uniref:acyl carrier protein n=1 Tax=Raoultibacter massiliensis TaxID=1852371 RepID=UPI000C84C78B|nr:acyl carrier protein [Raoultibacter massiliensis]
MTNKELYEAVFMDALDLVDRKALQGLEFQGHPNWDSVGHMQLISALEDAFDITIDPDDMIGLASFEKGQEIVRRYGIEL